MQRNSDHDVSYRPKLRRYEKRIEKTVIFARSMKNKMKHMMKRTMKQMRSRTAAAITHSFISCWSLRFDDAA